MDNFYYIHGNNNNYTQYDNYKSSSILNQPGSGWSNNKNKCCSNKNNCKCKSRPKK